MNIQNQEGIPSLESTVANINLDDDKQIPKALNAKTNNGAKADLWPPVSTETLRGFDSLQQFKGIYYGKPPQVSFK
jgi:hypothetical protein